MVSSTPDNQLGIRLILTSASAIVAEASTFPIDITKTRLQLQDLHCGVTRGAIRTAIGITQEEGFRGLYKGLPPALLRHVFYTSTRIATYEQLGTMMGTQESRHNQSMAYHALLGGISGMVGQAIASPADLVKVRMQSDGRLASRGLPARYVGIRDAFTKIVKEEGFLGLWKGLGPNIQRAFLVNMGELACYDKSKHFLISNKVCHDNVYAHTLASMMSGLCATTLSCPADVIKTRIMNQASNVNDIAPYRNSFDCLYKTVQKEGIMALWKGFFPTWARLGPWQLIFWVSYEQMRQVAGMTSF